VGLSAVWIGVENIAHISIRSWNEPACSDSLYCLLYSGQRVVVYDVTHVSIFVCVTIYYVTIF